MFPGFLEFLDERFLIQRLLLRGVATGTDLGDLSEVVEEVDRVGENDKVRGRRGGGGERKLFGG